MLISYDVEVGFDWHVTRDAETGQRPLELYLLEQTTDGPRLGTFARLEDGLPIRFLFYDLSAPATVTVGPEQQLADLTSQRPSHGAIQFRQYDEPSTEKETSPLAATTIDFGPDQSTHLVYSGVNTSIALAQGLRHTWHLVGAPNRLEHVGSFGVSLDLTVDGPDENGEPVRRSFFVDPEIIVEGNG